VRRHGAIGALVRALVTIDAVTPGSEVTGVSGLSRLFLELARMGVKIDVVTPSSSRGVREGEEGYRLTQLDRFQVSSWYEKKHRESGRKIRFFPFELGAAGGIPLLNVLFVRARIMQRVFSLARKGGYQLIHEYSASPLLLLQSSYYRTFFEGKIFHTLCTDYEGVGGHPALARLAFGGAFVDGVITLGKALGDRLSRILPKDKVRWIPLGLDLAPFYEARRMGEKEKQAIRTGIGLREGQTMILYVGPLVRRKGVFELASAFARVGERYPDSALVFAIPPSTDRESLRRVKEKLLASAGDSCSRVFFLEDIHDVPSLMCSCDIVVVPTRTSTGTMSTPLTLLEGLASGKPVVASAVRSHREVLTNGRNGLLFDGVPELARGLGLLLDSVSLRQHLGEAGLKVSERYRIETCAEKIRSLYDEEMPEGKRRFHGQRRHG